MAPTEAKKIDKMSPRELRIALKMNRSFLLAVAESCKTFGETSRSDITTAQFEAIAEEVLEHASKYI